MFFFFCKNSEASKGSSVVHGITYDLLQMHIHTLSEHTSKGEYADVELHFVHHNEELNSYAVIGVMCYAGDSGENDAFFSNLQSAASGAVNMDWSDLLANVDTTK